MATVLNLSVDQGANVEININVAFANGAVVDLTDYTTSASFKKHPTAWANTSTSFVSNGHANGLLQLTLSSVISANTPHGRYSYDAYIVHITNNTSIRVQEGIINFRPGVPGIV